MTFQRSLRSQGHYLARLVFQTVHVDKRPRIAAEGNLRCPLRVIACLLR